MLRSPLTVINSSITPLNARSIVLSVLLGSHPPEMPVGALIAFTSLFDVSAGATRTALSRMVTNGELEATDGRYRLGPRLLRRQAEQDTGRTAVPPGWDGSWWFVVVTADRRPLADRRRFREQALGARLGELRPDTWMRPANVDVAIDAPATLVTRGPLVVGDDRELAAQLWDLDALAGRTRELLADLDAVDAQLDAGDDVHLATAFVRLAASQRFLRTEPQLPEQLHRSDGAQLRSRYDEVVGRYQSQLADFLRRRRHAP